MLRTTLNTSVNEAPLTKLYERVKND